MTSARDNADLTRVGPGTLMGDLMPQRGVPACLSSDLEAGAPPMRLPFDVWREAYRENLQWIVGPSWPRVAK